MAKRLTEKQKKEIIKLFTSGINIDLISHKFDCTKSTISRNLKKILGDTHYNQLLVKSKIDHNKETKVKSLNKHGKSNSITANQIDNKEIRNGQTEEEFLKNSEFIELVPLTFDIDNSPQKDFSSIPLVDIDFPKTVFMIVDKKIELEIKFLKDYPKWQFLSEDELKRKTIEIHFDLKIAKGLCSNDQKVIKVPNTAVFKLVAPILRSRGISRIVSSDKLIAI